MRVEKVDGATGVISWIVTDRQASVMAVLNDAGQPISGGTKMETSFCDSQGGKAQ